MRSALHGHARKHELAVHNHQYPLHCPHCSKGSNVTKHEKIHTGERPFVFHVYDRGFNKRRNFSRHLLGHKGERPHVYTDCGRRITQVSNKVRHRRRQHSAESTRRHVFSECGKAFTKRGHLTIPLLNHTVQMPHACPECGIRSALHGHARKHELAVHNHQYPLHCPHCSKGCPSMNVLRNHVRARHRDEDNGEENGDQ
ncbi:zinc finger protein 133-like [Dermacentor silvarum]|uniref:zinc finger protein 133-like n=1 Tax=Dermacentor silvarum TaxID=543639 RepID=UPI00189AFA88|nr:zinc finger protein 133-like [Dermacentor silvarum]